MVLLRLIHQLRGFISTNDKALLITLRLLEVVLEVGHVGGDFILAELPRLMYLAKAGLSLVLSPKNWLFMLQIEFALLLADQRLLHNL